MTVTITRKRKKSKRLYKGRLLHMPSRHGKGKWHNHSTLWRYKLKARRLRRISAESRRRNRHAGHSTPKGKR